MTIHSKYSCITSSKVKKEGVYERSLLRPLCWFRTEEKAIEHMRKENQNE